jgi:enoyl-CoA hydratase/carnithine racemase
MIFLRPADLGGLDLDELLSRRELVVAMGEGDVNGNAAAALLFADFGVLHENATLHLDAPEAWAGAVWRIGRGVLRVNDVMTAGEARDAGLCDDVTERDPQTWLEEWMRHRSVVALDAAAALIRSRGGDRLERAEFARLFAIGEPQKGLGAFLAKTKPTYS